MTVAAFKKRDPTEPIISKGTVVFLASDTEEKFPMTIGESKNGQVLCRWHDEVGNLQGDWFYPEELYLPKEDEIAIEFSAEFDAGDAKDGA